MTARTTLAALAAALFLAGTGTRLAAQQQDTTNGDTFDWNGQLPAGAWLRIENLNGPIDVEAAAGSEASVHAVKQWRRGDPKDVRFAMHRNADGGVTICALWGDEATCDEHGEHSHGDHGLRHNDVSVHFTVKLPKGVRVSANTVNGALSVSGAEAEVRAHTVNGRIEAATSRGPVDASTVNGSIRVHMDALGGAGDLRYETVNGSITVELPASLGADVEMETVNGSLRSDFPLTLDGRIDPHHIRARIGAGGLRLRLSTVNGSVEIRKLS